MKAYKAIAAAALILGCVTAAHAHGGVRFGFAFGFPVYPAPYYYPPPVYYPPAVVTVPAPVYVESAPAQVVQQQPEQFWYYCPDSKTYYPYVQKCAAPWQRVAPRPAGS
jgi:hypothetical protein